MSISLYSYMLIGEWHFISTFLISGRYSSRIRNVTLTIIYIKQWEASSRFVLITCILMQITFKDDLIFVILADVELKLLFDVLFIYSNDHWLNAKFSVMASVSLWKKLDMSCCNGKLKWIHILFALYSDQ